MKVSICMMVKNESKYLGNCLESIQPIRDAVKSELIIIDTGSEDDTVEIASRYTDKIYCHTWDNDFSKMRNKTISYATGEWIFIIDADEVLQETDSIIEFLCSCKNIEIAAAAIAVKNITDERESENFSINTSPRLFKNDGYFHYKGTVHNQPVFKGMLIEIQASLLHYGYMAADKELMEKKFLRTSILIKKELEKDPGNIYYWFQLSVTYGMYGAIDQAIEYGEKAYELFWKQGDLKENRYALTNRPQMYQLAGNYPKVEEVCLELLEKKVENLDIYYYLAEAQAVMGKHIEAVCNYKKYLNLLEERKNMVQKDTTVIDYTLGNQQKTYFNLSLLGKTVGDDAMALHCAKKITRKDYILDNLTNIIDLFIRQGQYKELRKYYTVTIENDYYKLFYETLEQIKQRFSYEITIGIAEVFSDVNDNYGLLSSIILDNQQGDFSPKSLEKIKELDFSQLPMYCSEILYYLMRMDYPLQRLLVNFKENWINCLFTDVAKRHDDLSVVLYNYLGKYNPQCVASQYKLSKALCRYILLINTQTDDIYEAVFERYIRDGISYMNMIYAHHIINDVKIYDLKNDEEVFFLYMHHAQLNKKIDQVAYVKNLRKAMEAMPQMNKGIEMLLNSMQAENEEKEVEEYKAQVKNTIKQLIDMNQIEDAKSIIDDYGSIMVKDAEMYSMQGVIAILEDRINDAELIFQQARELAPYWFDVMYNLAYIYELQGQYCKAIIHYKKAKRLVQYNIEEKSKAENALAKLLQMHQENIQQEKSNNKIYEYLDSIKTVLIIDFNVTAETNEIGKILNEYGIDVDLVYAGYNPYLLFEEENLSYRKVIAFEDINDIAKYADYYQYDVVHIFPSVNQFKNKVKNIKTTSLVDYVFKSDEINIEKILKVYSKGKRKTLSRSLKKGSLTNPIKNNITLVIFTYNRTKYLERLLSFFNQYEEQNIDIIVLDSSYPQEKEKNQKICKKNNKLSICYFEFEDTINAWVKINYGLEQVKTPFVCLCADDDFITEEGLIESLNVLQKEEDLFSVKGKNLYYIKTMSKLQEYDFFAGLYDDDSLVRMENIVRGFVPSLVYQVFKTEKFRKLYSFWVINKDLLPNNPAFQEYLMYFMVLLTGKVGKVNIDFNIRDKGVPRETAMGNFPHALLDGTFNKNYQVFKSFLCNYIGFLDGETQAFLEKSDDMFADFLINFLNIPKDNVIHSNGEFDLEKLEVGMRKSWVWGR